MITCHQVNFALNYCEVTSTLAQVLIMLYNKWSDVRTVETNIALELINCLKTVDQQIVSKIIAPICKDLNKVAKIKAQIQLTKLIACLDMP